jgi:hypothetical protein
MRGQQLWETTIKKLLKEKNPCKICLVQASCRKSFAGNSACEKLAEALEKEMEKQYNENKT